MQQAKDLVQAFYRALDKCTPDDVQKVLNEFCDPGYTWRGMHPFNELASANAVADQFWKPLRHSITSLQRRQDIFMAGDNTLADDKSVWVVSMGHLMGLFDQSWLNIPPTRKMVFLRYCEFNQVRDGKIYHTAMFFDIPHLMVQAGVNPFPPQTGAEFVQPGPMTHQGLMFKEQDPAAGKRTLAVMNSMCDNCNRWDNRSRTLEEELAEDWHQDMIWWGPSGIGSSYTIERYAKQHSGPMRAAFKDRVFNGHVCKFAEGNFGGWFGWPNLSLVHTGGWMGMPASDKPSDMRVIDIYRREGDKLAENWVFIDMLHYYNKQGLDILGRLASFKAE